MTTSTLDEQIRTTLFQLREVHPESYIHLLLDPNHPCSPFDPLYPEKLGKREIQSLVTRVDRSDYAHDPSICPLLVTVYSPGDRGYPDELLLDQSIRNAEARCSSVNGAYVCGWLVSDRDAGAVAAHLVKACELFDLTAGKRRVLPLFEPHRLALAADADKPGFIRKWLGPISHWLLVDLAGELRVIKAEDFPGGAHNLEHLGTDEWAAQKRIGDAKVVLMALVDGSHVIPGRPETAIDSALQKAAADGMKRTEDIVFHALNGFTIGAGWASHPASRTVIQQALEGEETLSQLMSELSDDILDEIAASKQDPHA